ncbi:sigma-70 family RNA polymerase sigma factor [Luteolibacter sp. SL250]|uniref:sigma-70 family RNA polymerase sigma factor n=1 Tax=Luteolibacter sp. SL250 TaxID=2995170 RepID=UPI00226F2674|nr:sigma-70 family RNA polymerase sigma factor [Luteolibacter sp. SL250]WAC19273.1 sigma-70 family RNA polymerase sigma factor [Luteolibacter sp. SL250]
MAETPQTPEETVISLITRHQLALYSYILSLLPDRSLADDVLQETNLVIWRKAGEYDAGRPFMAWACRIAHFQVLAARRDAARDRCVFQPELVELLATEDEPDLESTDAMNHALRDCLEELPEEKRDLILNRYHSGSSVAGMAQEKNLTPGALSVQLHRIRQMLESCVNGKLNRGTP